MKVLAERERSLQLAFRLVREREARCALQDRPLTEAQEAEHSEAIRVLEFVADKLVGARAAIRVMRHHRV